MSHVCLSVPVQDPCPSPSVQGPSSSPRPRPRPRPTPTQGQGPGPGPSFDPVSLQTSSILLTMKHGLSERGRLAFDAFLWTIFFHSVSALNYR